MQKLIFEESRDKRRASSLPRLDVPAEKLNDMIPNKFLREEAVPLPEVSELDLVRHYTGLSRRNFGVDNGFYPLGSCTMKYNPKINEDMAQLPGFAKIHPYQEQHTVQGALELLYDLGRDLAEITGMEEMCLQPAAGAQGEWAGLMLIRAYHDHRGEGDKRRKVLVPDTAHGTNPASANVAGYDIVSIKTHDCGGVNLDHLAENLDDTVAALMLTNPDTLGLFEENIAKIAQMVDDVGALLYYDGANLNAIVGKARPGDMGFDVVHLNLHKTFSTPHGGGGPGAGPIGVGKRLVPFLPVPVVAKANDKYYLDYDIPLSVGKVKAFYGNFGVLVRTYAYIKSMGASGLPRVAENAVLNANYIQAKLKRYYKIAYDKVCMHEFVLSASKQKAQGVRALDIAKRLLDYGYHPPTIYFPLVVDEAMMIEPTETESKETLDAFIDTMIKIAKETEETPDLVTGAPYSTVVTRLDETTAARKPILTWTQEAR